MAPSETGETTDIVDILERSKEEFHASASGVPESLAAMRPEENRWSVLDCVEHVTTVEEIFLKRLAGGEYQEPPPKDREKESGLAARFVDRSAKRKAPEAIWPKGRFASLAEGLQEFHAARDRTIQFARERGADLYALASAHPVFGPLNGVEALIIIAGHARRHAEQIREVRAALENR
jgi:hypothetical protein